MRELVEEVRESLDPLLRERRVRLTTDLPAAVPSVDADRDRLLQVVVNLVSNAVKYCAPDEGWVALGVAVEADAIRVDVADNGPGIAEGDQALIFEKFVQVADAGGGRQPGSGLGLAISRHIVHFHGGRLWVRSVPGQGATFSFTIPRSDGGAATPEPVRRASDLA